MPSDQQIRKQIRRSIGLDIYRATLGGSDGRVDAPGLPGYVVIRYIQAGGAFSQPVTVRFRAVMKKTPGAAVIVGFDDDGELAVLRPDFVGETSAGTYPQGDNPADENVSNWIAQQRLITFVCYPVSSVANSMLVAVQSGTVINLTSNTVTLFPGSQQSLTAYIPASAGKWGLACLFWKTDNTIEVFASTPKDSPDDLGFDDINECMAARTAGSLPLWAWRLYNGQTGITPGAPAAGGDDFMDLRPLFFMLQSTSGTVTTTNNTATVIGTVTVAESKVYTIAGRIAGVKSDYSAACGGTFSATVRRAPAGNVTLVGSAVGSVQEDSGGSPVFTVGVNNTTQQIEILVTGITAETWNWRAEWSVT